MKWYFGVSLLAIGVLGCLSPHAAFALVAGGVLVAGILSIILWHEEKTMMVSKETKISFHIQLDKDEAQMLRDIIKIYMDQCNVSGLSDHGNLCNKILVGLQ